MAVKLKILGMLLCISVMGGMLWGCAPSIDVTNFTGDWEFLYGSQEELDQETVDLAKSLGSTAIMTLNEDGSGQLDLFNEITDLTWSAKTDTEGSVTVEGSNAAGMQLEDDQLILSDSKGQTLTFARPQS